MKKIQDLSIELKPTSNDKFEFVQMLENVSLLGRIGAVLPKVCAANSVIKLVSPQYITGEQVKLTGNFRSNTGQMAFVLKDKLKNKWKVVVTSPTSGDISSELVITGEAPEGVHSFEVHFFAAASGTYTVAITEQAGPETRYMQGAPLSVTVKRDLAWMLSEDAIRGCVTYPQFFFALSKSTVWDKNKQYEPPEGYHWATTAEGRGVFKQDTRSFDGSEEHDFGRIGNISLNERGGGRGMPVVVEEEEEEVVDSTSAQRYYRFKDSDFTSAYLNACEGPSEGKKFDFEETVEYFAGIVCMKD